MNTLLTVKDKGADKIKFVLISYLHSWSAHWKSQDIFAHNRGFIEFYKMSHEARKKGPLSF